MFAFKKISVIFKYSSKIPQRYKLLHSYIYKMDKAYFRRSEGAETFELTFQYANPDLKIDRQFNFNRRLSEKVDTLAARIAVNVGKVFLKKKKKDKTNSEQSNEDINVSLYQNGNEVSGQAICEELFKSDGDIRLRIMDKEYKIAVNTPWIKNAVLPTSILAGFPVYPSKFETFFVNKSLSEFTWFRSTDKVNWVNVGEGFLYTPTNNDINSYLKIHCVPKNETDVGIITEVISTSPVQANPGNCPFEIRHKFTQERLSGNNFRVVTYNLLADLYADSDYSREVLFPYCPPYALNMDYRKQLILKELMGFNADIICLQEVDEKIFDNDLNPVLSFTGIEGVFQKKGGTLPEGLACFYNSKRFRVIESLFVILGEEVSKNPLFADLWLRISENEKLAKRISDRTSTLHVVLLESIENNEILVVANTHFYFHPDADHIRLIQGNICINYLQDYKNKIKEQFNKRVSLIFCGDFNSVPDCGTYKLYTTGVVSKDIVDWKSNVDETIDGIEFKQDTILFSACGTPKYTNFTVGFQDCLDYIFCEKSNFGVTQIVPLPSYEELTALTAIPSVLFPSDHISLVADIKWL